MNRFSAMQIVRSVLTGWLVCASGCASSESNQSPTDAFLLIGQSNMSGRAPMIEGDDAVIEGVLLLNDRGAWEPARQPLNRYASDRKDLSAQRFNLGGPFAVALRESYPDRVPGLIVNARGGTKVELWQPGENLYERALDRVRSLDGVKLTGVLWHQGEGNAMDAQYAEKLETLINGIRRDLNQPDLPFIAGHIGIENIINDQMDALTQRVPFMRVVSVDGMNPTDGDGHFDRDGMIVIGQRYAEAYRLIFAERKADSGSKEEVGDDKE
jgi:glycerophosphoryl diester phosphodiesterase